MLGCKVNDPAQPHMRTITASDSESTLTGTPNFCGDYAYSYAPANPGETFAFYQTKFVMTGNTITFSSDDVADVTTLSPNPFRLTLTLSLVDYPS